MTDLGLFLLFIPIVIVGWIAFCHFTNSFSGWKTLADYYAYEGPLPPHKKRFQYGAFHYYWIYQLGYLWVLNIAVDKEALYIWIWKPFGPFEKKIRIPFKDVTKTYEVKNIFVDRKMTTFKTQANPKVKFAFNGGTAQWIEATWAALNDEGEA